MKAISRRAFCLSSGALCASAVANRAVALTHSEPPTKTGYAFDHDFVSFENNTAETYLRSEWIDARLVLTGVKSDLTPIAPHPNPLKYIKKIHTQQHISMIDRMPASSGFTLPIGKAARTAVGYALGAVQAVCEGTVRNAFCNIRPPGHHVQNDGEMGYCCYANVVIAAKFAREQYNIKRILIIDWDYHQGNGTHGFICGDDDILFFETYNPPMYSTECDDYITTGPNYAFPQDARRINVQMPSGSTNDDFVRTFESKLATAAERFKPELVLISCGFDLKKYDSHGSFNVTANGISRLTRIVRKIADTYAGGKLVSLLEGGYADEEPDATVYGTGVTFSGLSQCAENHIKTLITGDEQPETPFYSKSTAIGMRSPNSRYQNSVGSIPQNDGPWDITVATCNGKIVKRIYKQSSNPLHFKHLHLPTGHYVVSITGRTGSTYRSVKIVN